MTITAYTDASHCPQSKYAVVGWMLRTGAKTIKHTMMSMIGVPTSGDAEMYATVRAMQEAFLVKEVSKIIIITDYRLTTEARYYNLTKRSRTHPFFCEFKETIFMIEEDGIELVIQYSGRNSNPHSTKVDLACRKHLREIIKNNQYEYIHFTKRFTKF